MKTIAAHIPAKLNIQPAHSKDGCYKESDIELLKMRLLPGRGLEGEQLTRKVLEILKDGKESVQNRVFAVQSLARVKSAEAEDSLIRIVQKKDIRLSFPALNTLAFTGTARAFQALSAMRLLPIKSLQRQKDFTMLEIAYRLQLPGAEKLLSRLLEDARIGKRVEEYQLRFQPMKPEDIAIVLRQSPQADAAIPLSRKTGFQIVAGGQQFYFVFSSKLEDHTGWREALRSKQVAGQLFTKELHTTVVAQQCVALATPLQDMVQLSFFRKNGELFLLANVAYDEEKNSFTISNVKGERPRDAEKTELRLDENSVLTMNLSYIRHDKKRKTAPITDFTSATGILQQ